MGFIKSRLWDLVRRDNTQRGTVYGRATIPAHHEDDQPTVGLPHALGQNETRGYVGRRKDVVYRNRNVGPLPRGRVLL